jgi:hypothetical protein
MSEHIELDRSAAERWVGEHVSPSGDIEVAHDRPWATVFRIPITDGVVWFKACAPAQQFEPRLTHELFTRWPDTVTEVLAYDEQRAWLLLADAGTQLGARGNPPEDWLETLPAYASLQIGEIAHAADHITHGVPDMRLVELPRLYEDLLRNDLPLESREAERLGAMTRRFEDMCRKLSRYSIPDSIQHDDLHITNVYEKNGHLRILDWGDASIAHPFASLFETFRFLEERNHLSPDDPWFSRLRDAYLEPWGNNLNDAFELGVRVGAVARAIAWLRQRDSLPESARADFDVGFTNILQRALRAMGTRS